MASREGVEPSTFGFGGRCAAGCATEIQERWCRQKDLNLPRPRLQRGALPDELCRQEETTTRKLVWVAGFDPASSRFQGGPSTWLTLHPEKNGGACWIRTSGPLVRPRLSKPLPWAARPTLPKKHWYPRRDSNPQDPVSETGTYASSVTGANTKLVIHFGCALARSPRRVRCFAARGAGRAAAHITIAALTRGCDDGVHGHSRSGARALARHAAGDALTLFFARRWVPHPVRGAPCSDLLKNDWAAPGALPVRCDHHTQPGLG